MYTYLRINVFIYMKFYSEEEKSRPSVDDFLFRNIKVYEFSLSSGCINFVI